jgi:hypothetical protein
MKILVLVVCALSLIILSWIVVGKMASNSGYSTLGKAVEVQSFASLLGNPQTSKTECYPPEAKQASCLSFTYDISDEACTAISQAFGESECKSIQRHETYQQHDVAYSISIWKNGAKKLTVYLNESSY